MGTGNQRSIYERLGKVVGSSNRGFVSIDPERQPCIVTRSASKPAPGPIVPGAPGTTGTGNNTVRSGQTAARR